MTEEKIHQIKNLKDGEICYLNWFEEGGAEIIRIGDKYELYEVPAYGGSPILYHAYEFYQIEELVRVANTWT